MQSLKLGWSLSGFRVQEFRVFLLFQAVSGVHDEGMSPGFTKDARWLAENRLNREVPDFAAARASCSRTWLVSPVSQCSAQCSQQGPLYTAVAMQAG